MASQQPPGDSSLPGDGKSPNQSSGTGKPREKKRVGFETPVVAATEANDGQDDYSHSPRADEPSPLPCPTDHPVRRDSFSKDDVARALRESMPELHGGQDPPSKPSIPRPVLRKHSALDSNAMYTQRTPHRSELEARNRADRLAYAVGTSSAPASGPVSGPVSGRSSFEASESGPGTPVDNDRLLGEPGPGTPDATSPDPDLRPRKAGQIATELVRTHTRRESPLAQPHGLQPTGAATPVPYDSEYVPRPEKYQGGVLGMLLRLNSSKDRSTTPDVESSAPNTPARTPNRTPAGSPPESRSGSPKPEKRRLRNIRSQLVEGSMMFAAPGSARDIAEAVSERLRWEKDKPRKRSRSKQKLEEFRITVHIAEIISRHQYLIKLCHALMMYGAPTHRLENYMQMSARVLGIEGQFMYLPGTMIISFDDSNTHTTEVKLVRSPAGVDLGRLRDVHEIYKEVVHDLIGVEEATTRLTRVIDRKNKFPTWLRVLLFGVASATVAPFGFEGRYIDMPICFILGCLVGFLQLSLAPSNELYANVFEITAAVATSFMSRVFGSIHQGQLFCFSALAQSSIALILPGYIVLCASLELQSHQMISGSVRMVYALIYSLFLGYGITIGSVIYGYIDKNAVSSVHCSTGSSWYLHRPDPDFYILFVLPFTLCLCAINQAKWKQTPVMLFISLAGYVVSSFSARHFQGNTTLSSSLGAFCIGVLANLYSRLGRPVQNYILDIWDRYFAPRVGRISISVRRRLGRKFKEKQDGSERDWNYDSTSAYSSASLAEDPELGKPRPLLSTPATQRARKIGFGLAAAAMLPAIFVQVPSGLAVSGSLLSGVASADQITRNETTLANGTLVAPTALPSSAAVEASVTSLNSTAFNVLFSVIQVAIGISVGLSLSALMVYPVGKRRSGLFSF